MKHKDVLYSLIITIVLIIAVFFVIPKKPVTLRDLTVKYLQGNAGKTGPQTLIEKRGPVIYDIDKAKGEKPTGAIEASANLKEAPPEKDMGDSVQKAWTKVEPAEKARLMAELDKQIAQAQETLKQNPEDENAKHIIYVSETTKKFAENNFDYKAMEEIVKTETAKNKENKEKATSK